MLKTCKTGQVLLRVHEHSRWWYTNLISTSSRIKYSMYGTFNVCLSVLSIRVNSHPDTYILQLSDQLVVRVLTLPSVNRNIVDPYVPNLPL